MEHIKALGIKFVFTAVTLSIFFAIFNTSALWEILVLSVLVVGLSYVIGDLFILPRFGNIVATFSDFILSFFAVWLLALIFISDTEGIVIASAVSAMILTICEALFHSHMSNNVVKVKGRKSPAQRDREEEEKRKQPGNDREERAQERGLEDREK